MKHLSEFDATDLAELARADVARALAEDVGAGDLTAALVDASRPARARILARETAVICGRPWVEAAVQACDPSARLIWHVREGERCAADQVVLQIEGNAQALLTGSLEDAAAVVTAKGLNPQPVSGRQERLENLWNRFI